MKKQTIAATSIAAAFLFLFFSCEDKISSIELSPDKGKGNSQAIIGEAKVYSGTMSEDITSVDVYYDQKFVENTPGVDGSFEFEFTHLELGNHLLGVKGLDPAGATVAEASYNVSVIEKADLGEGDRPDLFDFDFPPLSRGSTGEDHTLWATYYYLPQVSSIANGLPLRDMQGVPLGPVLSLKHWCFSAMEGSVRVLGSNGVGTTYNYAGTTEESPVDCTKFFAWDVSKTKFRVAKGAYGDGVRQYKLVPFRTVAVDPTLIPYGSVLYIPGARGNRVTLPDGTKVRHDGYFFAGDTGGAIKGTHIDVYIGVSKANPFSWVKSRESGTFGASLVTDQAIIDKLYDLHVN
jgi:3D (Asp-Asp-Asp) domain-containing protein